MVLCHSSFEGSEIDSSKDFQALLYVSLGMGPPLNNPSYHRNDSRDLNRNKRNCLEPSIISVPHGSGKKSMRLIGSGLVALFVSLGPVAH